RDGRTRQALVRALRKRSRRRARRHARHARRQLRRHPPHPPVYSPTTLETRREHSAPGTRMLIPQWGGGGVYRVALCDTFHVATLTARAPRRIGAPIVLILPALLFGLLVSVQWRTQLERSELSVRYNAPLLDAARSLQSEQEVLKKQLADLRTQLDAIQRGAASQSTASRDLQAQIEDLRSAAGLTERTGDGVQIVLDDAHTTVTAPAANVDKS